MSIEGLIAFPVTPMSEDGCVDAPGMARLVRRLVASGVDGICVLGSTGSYPYLSREERRRAIEYAAREVDGRVPLMAGVGALRTDMAVLHCQDARAAGAAMGLLAPMSYTPLTDEEVFRHYEAVAEAGGLPLCIYDAPRTTHFAIGNELLARLAAIPGAVAVKVRAPPSGISQRVTELRSLLPEGVLIGFSGDAYAPAGLIAGADAWHSILAGLFPAPAVAIREAAAAGDSARVNALVERLEPLWNLFRDYGAIRVVYAAANLTGICSAQPPRPILPLAPDGRRLLSTLLEQLDPLLTGIAHEEPL